MKEATAQRHIDAPPREVFEQMTSLEDAPRFIKTLQADLNDVKRAVESR